MAHTVQALSRRTADFLADQAGLGTWLESANLLQSGLWWAAPGLGTGMLIDWLQIGWSNQLADRTGTPRPVAFGTIVEGL